MSVATSLVRRRRTVILFVGCAVVAMAAGFGAAQLVKSPQQLAAEAAGPGPSILTAVVEKRVLQSTVVLRGDVASSQQADLTPSLASASGKAVVTAVRVKQGDQVEAGQVLLEVSGRPLFVLPGDKPAYRDLRPGSDGEDVRQLQMALKSLGFDPRENNGVYGLQTKTAVTKLYQFLGYPISQTSLGDDQAVTAAQKQVKSTQRALQDAQDALKAALNAAADNPPGSTPNPPSTTQSQTSTSGSSIGSLRKQVTRAQQDLADAEQAEVDVEKRTGAMVPLSEYAFLPSFPARIVTTKAVLGKAVDTPLMTLSSGALQVQGLVNPGQVGFVKAGQPVQIASETLGVTAEGRVTSVGDFQQDKTTGVGGHPVLVVPTHDLDPRLGGTNVRLTIATASSNSEVLAVPVSALFASVDGMTNLIKRLPNGREEKVQVSLGVNGNGLVAVTSVSGSLTPGDRVVISAENVPGQGAGISSPSTTR